MERVVSIVQRNGDRQSIHLHESDFDGLEARAAREMIAELYNKAEIDTPTSLGKILLVDQILLLAQEQKAELWAAPTPQLRRYLAAALTALGRDSLTVNLRENSL